MSEVIKEVLVSKVVDVICDICGNSCKDSEDKNLEYAEIYIPGGGWGFDSGKDGENHICHMCEGCYDKVRNFIENELGGKIRVDCYL